MLVRVCSIFLFHMSETSQHARISKYIQEIQEICTRDQTKVEVAIVNFKSLLTAMKLYDRAPRYFNSIFDDDDNQYMQQDDIRFDQLNDPKNGAISMKPPILNELEKIYGRKLKQPDLQQLGSVLASKIHLKLDRNTKRSKALLIKWFETNWQLIYPKIYECNLNQMEFQRPKSKTIP